MHDRGINFAVNISALRFLCKNNRNVEIPRTAARDRDAGSFDCQNSCNARILIFVIECLPDFIEQFHIQLVVKKTVYFKNVAGTNLAVFSDTIFKKFHFLSPKYISSTASARLTAEAQFVKIL